MLHTQFSTYLYLNGVANSIKRATARPLLTGPAQRTLRSYLTAASSAGTATIRVANVCHGTEHGRVATSSSPTRA